jgi:hypothetical protein
MTDVIEPVLNSTGGEYFKILDYNVSIKSRDSSGWPETVEASVDLGKTELADKIVAQDYQWIKDNGFERRFSELVDNDDGSVEKVFKQSKVDEAKKMIEEQEKSFTESFTTRVKSNIYGRKNLVENEIVLTDKGRGEWR